MITISMYVYIYIYIYVAGSQYQWIVRSQSTNDRTTVDGASAIHFDHCIVMNHGTFWRKALVLKTDP